MDKTVNYLYRATAVYPWQKGAFVKIGDKVTFRPEVMRFLDDADKYKSGIVNYCGSWNVIGVKFIGIDHTIYVREDELQML